MFACGGVRHQLGVAGCPSGGTGSPSGCTGSPSGCIEYPVALESPCGCAGSLNGGIGSRAVALSTRVATSHFLLCWFAVCKGQGTGCKVPLRHHVFTWPFYGAFLQRTDRRKRLNTPPQLPHRNIQHKRAVVTISRVVFLRNPACGLSQNRQCRSFPHSAFK